MVLRRSMGSLAGLALAGLALVAAMPAQAQVQSIDPNTAIDSDLAPQPGTAAPGTTPALPAASGPTSGAMPSSADALPGDPNARPSIAAGAEVSNVQSVAGQSSASIAAGAAPVTSTAGATYHSDDLIGAAEGVFGKGAKGLALMIQDILKKQGEPNGYIVGREAGGALVVGLRYGSGTLHHKVEGERPVYWTGPSIGFDAGANAGNCFVLVYNLYDSEELFKRFPAGEGQAYLVGGFNASYLRRGNTVLIPVRLGVGLRLGVNAGYMKFSRTQKWLPF